MIALDTNLLIYAHRSSSREHSSAKNAIEQAANHAKGCGIASPVIVEFWCIATGSDAIKDKPQIPLAKNFLEQTIQDCGFDIWYPNAGFASRLTETAQDLNVTGARIFDLQIALIALENGASEIWTHDRSFQLIPGLKRYDPIVRVNEN